jgi:hypothetical protein
MPARNGIIAATIISHVIVIPSGMDANYSKWIKQEIKGSKTYNKPILAVNPFGQPIIIE